MAFNPNDYVKNTSKPAAQRIVDSIVSTTTAGKGASTLAPAQATAASLLNMGASARGIMLQAASQVDSLTSPGSDEFYAFTGKNVVRATSADITRGRLPGTRDPSVFYNQVPESKIRRSRDNNDVQIITVI